MRYIILSLCVPLCLLCVTLCQFLFFVTQRFTEGSQRTTEVFECTYQNSMKLIIIVYKLKLYEYEKIRTGNRCQTRRF
jgi:hypothetical protein